MPCISLLKYPFDIVLDDLDTEEILGALFHLFLQLNLNLQAMCVDVNFQFYYLGYLYLCEYNEKIRCIQADASTVDFLEEVAQTWKKLYSNRLENYTNGSNFATNFLIRLELFLARIETEIIRLPSCSSYSRADHYEKNGYYRFSFVIYR